MVARLQQWVINCIVSRRTVKKKLRNHNQRIFNDFTRIRLKNAMHLGKKKSRELYTGEESRIELHSALWALCRGAPLDIFFFPHASQLVDLQESVVYN